MTTLDDAISLANAFAETEHAFLRVLFAEGATREALKERYDAHQQLFADGLYSEWAGHTPETWPADQRAQQLARLQVRPVFRAERFETESHGPHVAVTIGGARNNDFGFVTYERMLWVGPDAAGRLRVLAWSHPCPRCGASGFAKGTPPDVCAECRGVGWQHPNGKTSGTPLRPTRRIEDQKLQRPTFPRNVLSWDR
jgi:hypothetical protein